MYAIKHICFKSLLLCIGAFFLADGIVCAQQIRQKKKEKAGQITVGIAYGDFSIIPNSTFSRNWNYTSDLEAFVELPILKSSRLNVGLMTGNYESLLPDSIANYSALSIYGSFLPIKIEITPYVHLEPEIGIGLQRIKADRSFEWVGDGAESEIVSLLGIQLSVPLFERVHLNTRLRYMHVLVYHDYGYMVWNVGAKVDLGMPNWAKKWWKP